MALRHSFFIVEQVDFKPKKSDRFKGTEYKQVLLLGVP